MPLRICYAGDVLYAKSEELYADRQQTQVGFEIIGCDKKSSNLEVVKLLLSALAQIEATDLLIEFSLPGFLEEFLEKNHIENSSELREAIMKKFPNHGIIGEEYGNHQIDAENIWIIDPIDGTSSFIIG